MERVPIEGSGSLRSVAYDESSGALEIEFASGNVYSYYLVPPHVVGELLSADSKGTYFREKIRGKFPDRPS